MPRQPSGKSSASPAGSAPGTRSRSTTCLSIPGWMRQGIGRALVLDLIAIARGRGTTRVEVTANQHALAFYEKVGFVVYREDATRFGPAPRMRLAVTPAARRR